MSIADQLRAGVRFFDMRIGMTYGNDRIVMMHGDYIIDWTSGGILFKDVLQDVYTFLTNSYKETVIVSIMKQGVSDTSGMNSQLQQWWKDKATYWYQASSSLPPNLGAARGKIILFNRTSDFYPNGKWGIDMSDWTDNSVDFTTHNVNVEDYYTPSSNYGLQGSIDHKWSAVTSALSRAQLNDGNLHVIFTSATNALVFPQDFANGFPTIDGINDRLRKFFENYPPGQSGVFPMDYPEEPEGELITAILEGNFPKT